MDDFIVLVVTLTATGGAFIGGIFGYEMIWKPRRQRRLEREHARSKLRGRSG